MKKPEIKHKQQQQRGSVVPYVFAWFLGVPGSLLFVIFVLRGFH